MSIGKTISIIGFSLVFMYIISQILNFYEFSVQSYGTYITFYVFILFSMLILPNNYSSLKYLGD